MSIKYIDPYKTTFSYNVSMFFFIIFCIVGLPSLVIYTLLSFCYAEFSGEANTSDWLYFSFYFISLAASVGIMIYTNIRHRKNLNGILTRLKSNLAYDPRPSDEYYGFNKVTYMGVDTQKGTILYIAHVDRTGNIFTKDMLIMGFDTSNWRNIELKGNSIKIYTKTPDIPFIEFSHKHASHLFETISAMKGRTYEYELNAPGYIEHMAKQITEKMGLNLILPRN